MKEIVYTVTSPVGIHARPTGFLVKEAKKYASKIELCGKDGKRADATQLLAGMSLDIKCNDTVTLFYRRAGRRNCRAAAEKLFS